MTVGLNSTDEAPVRRAYARLRSIRDDAAARTGIGAASLELSMGMSRDMAWAIAEGATIVRLGTAVFDARPPASPHPPEPDGTRTRTGWNAH